MNQEIIQKAGALISANTAHMGAENPACVLSQIDLDGSPTAATITPSKSDGIAWITFCSGLESNWAKRIARDPRACVCFSTGAYNLSLIGTLEADTDPAVKREMWYAGLEAHFAGPDDPAYCVLRFRTLRYNLFVDWKEARGAL